MEVSLVPDCGKVSSAVLIFIFTNILADVHASDKGGLVPLHNSSSYGHFEVTELLIKHGANVNAADLWKFTPLHEASAKGKYEIVKLLLKNGADPAKKNRDAATPLDLVRDGNQEVADLLR
jgi:tankyrase